MEFSFQRNPKIHPFIHHVFTENLLHARHCGGPWVYGGGRNTYSFCFSRVFHIFKRMNSEEV